MYFSAIQIVEKFGKIHVHGPLLLCKLAQNRLMWYQLVEHLIIFDMIPHTW